MRFSVRPISVAIVCPLFLLVACSSDLGGEGGSTAPSDTEAAVVMHPQAIAVGLRVTSSTGFQQGQQTLTVAWSSGGSSATDWIRIAPANTVDQSSGFTWSYTGTTTAAGSMQLPVNLPAGTWWADFYSNWTAGTSSNATWGRQTAQRAIFTVTSAGAATVSGTTAGAYQTINASWTNMPGFTHDWIGLVPRSAATASGSLRFTYTNGAVNGSGSLDGVPPGSYDIVAVQDWPSGGYTILARSPIDITVTSTLTLATTCPTGTSFHDSTLAHRFNFTGAHGYARDWIGIYDAGAPGPTQFLRWAYVNQTNGAGLTGIVNSPPLPNGNYLARLYENDGYNLLAEQAFDVVSTSGACVCVPAQPCRAF